MTTSDLIRIAGVVQLGILLASALVPSVLDWKRELSTLSALVRHLIWVHGGFIVYVIVAFGLLALVLAGDLADGSRLSRAICATTGVFWLARLGIQLALFDARPYLTSTFLKLGYNGLTVAFTFLSAVFLFAALR
jgi:hypothetical protein